MPAPPPHDSPAISCPHCDYDLRAHVCGDDDDALIACPECGERFTAEIIRTLLRERAIRVGWRNWLLVFVPALAGVIGIPMVEGQVSETLGVWLLWMFVVLGLGYLFVLSYRFWRPHPVLMSAFYAGQLTIVLAIANAIVLGMVGTIIQLILHFTIP